MFHILGFIFFLVLIVLVFGLIIVLKIVGTVRRVGRRMKGTDKSSSPDYAYTGQQQSEDASSSAASARKKVFSDDEGEYVDFEEIKDK